MHQVGIIHVTLGITSNLTSDERTSHSGKPPRKRTVFSEELCQVGKMLIEMAAILRNTHKVLDTLCLLGTGIF